VIDDQFARAPDISTTLARGNPAAARRHSRSVAREHKADALATKRMATMATDRF
jgi:hypothetical protein